MITQGRTYTPRRGRRDKTRTKRQQLNLSMSPESVRVFDKAAWDAGMSISKWLEMVGLKAAGQTREEGGAQ